MKNLMPCFSKDARDGWNRGLKTNKDVGIIMVTAVKEEHVCKEAMKSGADEYITKPVKYSYLESRIFIDIMARRIRKSKEDRAIEKGGC